MSRRAVFSGAPIWPIGRKKGRRERSVEFAATQLSDELRSQRISLDIIQYGQQVVVVMNRTLFESALPNMSMALIVAMTRAHVRRQPHPVEIVRLVNVGQNSQRQALVGPGEQVDKGGVFSHVQWLASQDGRASPTCHSRANRRITNAAACALQSPAIRGLAASGHRPEPACR